MKCSLTYITARMLCLATGPQRWSKPTTDSNQEPDQGEMGLRSVLVWLKAGYEASQAESTTVQGRGGDSSWDPHLNDRIWSMEDSRRKKALSQFET